MIEHQEKTNNIFTKTSNQTLNLYGANDNIIKTINTKKSLYNIETTSIFGNQVGFIELPQNNRKFLKFVIVH